MGVEVLASSSVYDTDPVGELLDQPSFLNACLRVRTALEPLELLDAVKGFSASSAAPPVVPATGRVRSISTSCCSVTSSCATSA